MPGGRPPKPLAVLEISGATRKNPGRYRARKQAAAVRAKLPPLGAPPSAWVAGQSISSRCRSLLENWESFVEQDRVGLRVLNASHHALVKLACQLQYKIDRWEVGYGKATSGDWSTMQKYLGAMGMTPIDSSRLAEAVRIPERGASASGAPARSSGWGELVG